MLFALQSPDSAELAALVDSDFQEAGGLQRAIDLVKQSGGLADAKALAQQEADLVRTCGSSCLAAMLLQCCELLVATCGGEHSWRSGAADCAQAPR